ncbi:hypothetical protein CLU84_2482 [Comamonas sp. 26]|nr:hypothetical protein CLU84_2482 [Comamonas sp. 26]
MKRFQPMLATAILLGLISPLLGNAMTQAHSNYSTLGTPTSSYSGQITGNGVVQYGLDTRPHQQLTVQLNTNNPSSRINVIKDGSAKPLCQSSATQNTCSFRTEPDANYRVLVSLTPEAAQRGESARFTLTVAQGI